MKIWQVAREWSIDGMELAERPIPEPRAGEVAVAVRLFLHELDAVAVARDSLDAERVRVGVLLLGDCVAVRGRGVLGGESAGRLLVVRHAHRLSDAVNDLVGF